MGRFDLRDAECSSRKKSTVPCESRKGTRGFRAGLEARRRIPGQAGPPAARASPQATDWPPDGVALLGEQGKDRPRVGPQLVTGLRVLDFDQLHTFLEIVRLNSFSKAAKTCYRTQPAISAQIRQMEQELGMRLFDRFGSKITLTTAGRLFAKYARRILDLRREGFDKVRELEHVAKGEMSMAANEATCIHVLPGVFARYREQFPGVRIQVVRAYGTAIFESVVDNSVDFGITQLPLHDKRLAVVQIYSDEVMLLTSREHRFAGRKSVGAKEIVKEDLLLPKTGRTRRRIDEYLDPYEDQIRVSMELESSEMQKRFTEANLGITFLAATSAREEIRDGRLKAIRLLPLPMIRTIGLIYRKDKALSLASLGLIRLVGEFAEQTGLGLPSVRKAS